MEKLSVSKIKARLLGKELSFDDLDSFMVESGYLPIERSEEIILEIKSDLYVIYSSFDGYSSGIEISFEITINNGKDEVEDAFYLKVIGVQEY